MGSLEDDIAIIKSLIAIAKGGLPVFKLSREYYEMTETRLNYAKYGFKSLIAMLESSHHIVLKQTQDGIMCHVTDEKMSHVTSLVARTNKPSKSKKYNSFKTRPSYHASSRGFSSPHRPQQSSSPSHYANYNKQSTQTSRYSPFRNEQRVPRQAVPSSNNRLADRPLARNVTSSIPRPVERNSAPCQTRRNCDYPVKSTVSSSSPDKPQKCNVLSKPFVKCQFNTCNASNSDSNKKTSLQTDLKVSNLDLKENFNKSNYGSDWSSDSSVHSGNSNGKVHRSKSSSGWSSSSSLIGEGSGMERINPRKCDIYESTCKKNSKVTVKLSSGHMTVRNINVCVPQKNFSHMAKDNSVSDWSLDSASGSEDVSTDLEMKNNFIGACSTHTSQPLQNNRVEGFGMSLPSQQINGKTSSLLKSGSIGQGKFQSDLNQVMVKAHTKRVMEPNKFCNAIKGTLQPSLTDIDMQGTPNRLIALAILKNRISSIVVNVPNASAPKVLPSKTKGPSLHVEPCYKDFQFIGDYLLLRVSEVSLRCKIQRNGSVSYCGPCRNNLTISECEKEIVNYGVPRKVVLMIGMTDILQGSTLEKMREDMSSLLQSLEHVQLILLSLPVPPSFIKVGNENKLTVLELFNRWLLKLQAPIVVDIDRHLYSDEPFYMRVRGSNVETFSEDGCWTVMDEIMEAINSSL